MSSARSSACATVSAPGQGSALRKRAQDAHRARQPPHPQAEQPTNPQSPHTPGSHTSLASADPASSPVRLYPPSHDGRLAKRRVEHVPLEEKIGHVAPDAHPITRGRHAAIRRAEAPPIEHFSNRKRPPIRPHDDKRIESPLIGKAHEHIHVTLVRPPSPPFCPPMPSPRRWPSV